MQAADEPAHYRSRVCRRERTLIVSVRGDRYRCDLAAYTCAKQPIPLAHQQTQANGQPPSGVSATATGGNAGMSTNPVAAAPLRPGRDEAVVSPDGKRAVFIRNWNLWARDVATGDEKQLTTDGVTNYGYATDNAGWTHSNRAIVVWSPDSKMVATFQQDQRKTGMMYLVSTNVGHPTLDAWPYPLPGDKDVTMIERVVIDTDSGKVTRLKTPPDQHRSSPVRRHQLPRRRMGRRAVGRRRQDHRISLHQPRPPRGRPEDGRRCHGRCAAGLQRDGLHLF